MPLHLFPFPARLTHHSHPELLEVGFAHDDPTEDEIPISDISDGKRISQGSGKDASDVEAVPDKVVVVNIAEDKKV